MLGPGPQYHSLYKHEMSSPLPECQPISPHQDGARSSRRTTLAACIRGGPSPRGCRSAANRPPPPPEWRLGHSGTIRSVTQTKVTAGDGREGNDNEDSALSARETVGLVVHTNETPRVIKYSINDVFKKMMQLID